MNLFLRKLNESIDRLGEIFSHTNNELNLKMTSLNLNGQF